MKREKVTKAERGVRERERKNESERGEMWEGGKQGTDAWKNGRMDGRVEGQAPEECFCNSRSETSDFRGIQMRG